MHQSVMDFVAEEVEKLNLKDPWIVELGSYNVNGTLRDLFPNSQRYAGLDIRPGPGVDYVTSLDHWPAKSTDLLLCAEMLEHDKYFWKTIGYIWDVLVPGGHVILTARGFDMNGAYPMHEVPDYWRFTKEGMQWLFSNFQFSVLTVKDDPYMPGVFITARKPYE